MEEQFDLTLHTTYLCLERVVSTVATIFLCLESQERRVLQGRLPQLAIRIDFLNYL